jgi:ABC-type uncharacterized transport system substrate-binding protein
MRYKVVLLVFAFINILYAHPHTFIDLYPKVIHKNNTITSLHMTWKFDEMTSQMLVMEFDQNGNGKIDKEENKYIKENYFDPLKDYGFYTYVTVNKKRISIKPTNFIVAINKEGFVTYEFDIELNIDKKSIFIDFYDEDNFTAFMLKKEFVSSNIPYIVRGIDQDFYYARRLEFR